jgi:TolA-binding protein
MQSKGQGIPARRDPRTIEGKARPMPNASHQKSLNEYQTALQWMHESKYDKARMVFEKLSQYGPVEILERNTDVPRGLPTTWARKRSFI